MQDLHENHVLVIVDSCKNITITKKKLPDHALSIFTYINKL